MLPLVVTELINSGAAILADGAVETRIEHETDLDLCPHLGAAALLERPDGRAALRVVYRSYLDVAWTHELPVLVGTPTTRASRRYVERAGHGGEAVRRLNAVAVAFLEEVRGEAAHGPVYLAGAIGQYGAAGQPEDCLNHLDGADYHAEQVSALVDAGVDMLIAQGFTSIEEAHGAAIAMSVTGLPYAVGFALDDRGRLPDLTYLHAAIERIDDMVDPAPTHYSLSCVRPRLARVALENLHVSSSQAAVRLREVKACTAEPTRAGPAAWPGDGAESPEAFGAAMHQLGIDFDVPILGGCCGTGAKHLAALARRLGARTA